MWKARAKGEGENVAKYPDPLCHVLQLYQVLYQSAHSFYRPPGLLLFSLGLPDLFHQGPWASVATAFLVQSAVLMHEIEQNRLFRNKS